MTYTPMVLPPERYGELGVGEGAKGIVADLLQAASELDAWVSSYPDANGIDVSLDMAEALREMAVPLLPTRLLVVHGVKCDGCANPEYVSRWEPGAEPTAKDLEAVQALAQAAASQACEKCADSPWPGVLLQACPKKCADDLPGWSRPQGTGSDRAKCSCILPGVRSEWVDVGDCFRIGWAAIWLHQGGPEDEQALAIWDDESKPHIEVAAAVLDYFASLRRSQVTT